MGLLEEWRPVLGFEGLYEVSNLGRVKSLARTRKGKSGCDVPMPERIMRINPLRASGRTRPYMYLVLRKGEERTVRGHHRLVHRLVAEAFIRPLAEKEHVDHIDGQHANNVVDNLRILSASDHGKIHPWVVDPALNSEMQRRAKKTLRELRIAGKIVGRNRIAC